jgi:hypothetical protein
VFPSENNLVTYKIKNKKFVRMADSIIHLCKLNLFCLANNTDSTNNIRLNNIAKNPSLANPEALLKTTLCSYVTDDIIIPIVPS